MNHSDSNSLTKFLPGGIGELASVIWPLVLSFLSASLMNFFNRLFLSHYSIEALEASVTAMNLAMLFQIPCMRITSVAQIFVARFAGAQQFLKIGPVVWQMIWFSFLTVLATVPIGLATGTFFFRSTVIEAQGFSYFACLMAGNFLFPLGAALCAFYVGLGRTRTIIITLALVHLLQICLDRILIFGISGWLAPQGAMGAAVSTIIAQGFYCSVLFILFLRKKEQEAYGTKKCALERGLLRECMVQGVPRSMGKLLILIAWTGTVAIITHKGGDFLLIFSLGASLYAFFSCLNEGLAQGLMTIASFYLGSGKKELIPRIVRSALIVLGIVSALLSIILVFFPQLLLRTFFSHELAPHQTSLLIYSCYGLWFFFLCEGLAWIGYSVLNALKDLKFYMFYTLISAFFFNYLPMHLAFVKGDWTPEKIWWLMSIPCLAAATAYVIRISSKLKIESKLENEPN